MQTGIAPDWALTHLKSGNQITQADYADQPVLMFFFNIGCDGCMMRGLPVAAEIARQYPEINVIGVHSTFGAFAHNLEQISAEIDKRDLPFPVLMDDNHVVFDAFEAEGTPHWVFISADAQIERSIFGSQPNALQRLEYGLMEQFGN